MALKHDEEKIPQSQDTLADLSETELRAQEKSHEQKRSVRSIHSTHNDGASEHSTVGDDDIDLETAAELDRIETQRKPIVKVPASQRRGLFARFAVVAEVTEPLDYTNNVKWFITFIVSIAAAAAPLGSSIIFREHLDLSAVE